MAFQERSLQNIMSCTAYISIYDENFSNKDLYSEIHDAENYLRTFQERFTRFSDNNELTDFNESTEQKHISPELIEMLKKAKDYYEETNGIFNIAILQNLKNEGYTKSKDENFIDAKYIHQKENLNINALELNLRDRTTSKPRDLKVDLGGIGKGYAIDKVSKLFRQKHKNFCIEVGGDMFLSGVDKKEGYGFWAIEVEDPHNSSRFMETLLVKDKGIATSGTNKRKWINNGKEKSHIIDTRTGKSLENELLTVTIIGNSAEYADVMAKTALILGLNKGLEFCDYRKIPALFIDKNGKKYVSKEMDKYVWKN